MGSFDHAEQFYERVEIYRSGVENSSDKFDIGYCLIKVKGSWRYFQVLYLSFGIYVHLPSINKMFQYRYA